VHTLATSNAIYGIPQLGLYLLTHKPQAILTPNVRLTVLALRASRLAHPATGVYANVHNTYGRTFQRLSASKAASRTKRIQDYYPRCRGIIAVSQGVAEDFCQLTGLPRQAVTVIHNPVVTPALQALAGQALSHPWFSPDTPPVVLSVGRLEEQKNIPLLIEAFEQARAQIPCRLVLIGDGTHRASIESRVASSAYAEDIALLGHQDNPFNYMRQAAVFVLSSRWEGFGNVLAEAMATGTPVVSTDCPSGPREVLDNGRFGTLVPMDDVAALAAAIVDTLHSPTAAETLQTAAARYDAIHVARQYLQCFGLNDNIKVSGND
jgi:glycosyltransferase involved in cell wall biosynthesis